MINTNHNPISLHLVDQKNNNDLTNLYLLMKDEKGMQIRNQRSIYTPKEFEAYFLHTTQADNHFILVSQDDKDIGYFQASLNKQHRLAQIYFTFLWNHEDLSHAFVSAFNLLTTWLKENHQIERIALPITGEHTDIQKLLLSNEQIKQSIVLAQEHLDKDNQRQPVTFYDCFIARE